jgi:ferrous iron transport protein B
MLSGYACAIPAIMATRTMERQRDRLLTMMVVPIMTCSARLPVYTLIIAALFPAPSEPGGLVGFFSLQALLMVLMYVFSTAMALLAAAVLGRTLFKGTTPPLLLELPPYRMPHPRSVLRMMWERSRLFVTEAGTVILTCSVVLWILISFPRDVDLSRDYAAAAAVVEASDVSATDRTIALADLASAEAGERMRNSWGGRLGRAIEPVIRPLGYDWKIGIGLIGAFAAREVFVSTMGIVYGVGSELDEDSVPLRDRLQAETWPDGRRVYTPLVGLSLMVFFALAAQCMSTLAVVRRETRTWRWPIFLFTYMTVLAWVCSFLTYQGGRLLGFE